MIEQDAKLISDLQSSFLLFIKTFYPLLTGRQFLISSPISREPHVITVCRELVKCANLESLRTIVNIPPGHGKSTMLAFWVAWCFSKYADCRFLYISYAQTLAATHTDTIRRIMMMREYRDLFGIELRSDSKAKDKFQTTAGGQVVGLGSTGAITGLDAGYPNLPRLSGAVIMDDMHKPDEVFSDTMREKVINNYRDTIQQRARSANVPFIGLGQRLHEADLWAYLLEGKDGHEWRRIILKSIDDSGNALYPEAFPLEMLRIRQERDIYVFAAQHQQDPQPAGGSMFKSDWFVLLDEEPDILMTFITADTAESTKEYADFTVFSFWGLYEIETFGRKTGEYGLHWIDCVETKIEPKDLKDAFIEFWQDCMRHKKPPLIAAIEKKSTGTTLLSMLSEVRGIQIRNIERTKESGSKATRFLACQPHIAAKKISFLSNAKHKNRCIEHCVKITANDSHRHDDIMDTLADAIKIALIDKTLSINPQKNNEIAAMIAKKQRNYNEARTKLYQK